MLGLTDLTAVLAFSINSYIVFARNSFHCLKYFGVLPLFTKSMTCNIVTPVGKISFGKFCIAAPPKYVSNFFLVLSEKSECIPSNLPRSKIMPSRLYFAKSFSKAIR